MNENYFTVVDGFGEYIVESVDKEFILNANITNKGESAYEAKLFVFHPKALSYINVKTEQGKQVHAYYITKQLKIITLLISE